MNISDFKDLIRLLPEPYHSFRIKRSNWERFFEEPNGAFISSIFTNEVIEISRKDIQGQYANVDLSIVMTILWGYPDGMRGDNFKRILARIDDLKNHLNEIEESGIPDWSMNAFRMNGLGLSTYSKLLYFLKIIVQGIPAVILDQRIIDVIQKGIFSELEPLRPISYQNAWRKYPEYLRIIDSISRKYSLPHGKIEMFLFEFGLNIKVDE